MPAVTWLLITGTVGVVLLLVYNSVVHCPASAVLVKYNRLLGLLQSNYNATLHRRGPIFLIPLIESCDYLELSPHTVSVDLEEVFDGDLELKSPTTYHIKISLTDDQSSHASSTLLKFWEMGTRPFNDHLRELITTAIPRDHYKQISTLNDERNAFLLEWEQSIKQTLEGQSLEYLSLSHKGS